MRFEKRRIRRILARNTLLFFVTFAVLFALVGVLTFQMASSNLYRSADAQLEEVRSLLVNTVTEDQYAAELARYKETYGDSVALDASAMALDAGIESSADADPSPSSESGSSSGESASSSEGFVLALEEDAPDEALDTSEAYVASNPQLVYLWRDAAGEAVDMQGLYAVYPTYFNDIPFDTGDLDRIYEVRAGDHVYRGINYEGTEEDQAVGDVYLQVLVNVDSELALLDDFTRVLVGYLFAAVLVAAAVSYFLSRKTIKPIVASMNRQTEFVQNASHELRTPLTIIRAAQDRLLASPSSRIVDKFEDVSAVADETRRLSRLVDDLMTLTMADASADDEHETAPIDVRSVVIDVGELYADVVDIGEKTLSVDARATGSVRIDADALRQILGILLDNALKYTDAGGSIELRCEERGGFAVIAVADSGCGILAEERERVFERFYRADAARTTSGSGLGLSIARALVEHVRGTIEIKGNEPRGTVVLVALPKARA